ncbi:hypothetical protein GpartN1_g6790.t1 [Galdieria partita]|uniref:Sphingolipid delta-4 desaturase n=1 Tax=Galdieria partita TaxID=83374 RepID=A0A9C7Q288_9RHOD|nr:hypothetical protein GpartN1_g6790.t1 [Galdieria partita]
MSVNDTQHFPFKELSTEAEELRVQNATRRKHPHGLRREEILRQHPEIAKLYGLYPVSAIYIVLLVFLQWLLAIFFTRYFPWYLWVLATYAVGAVIDHALWVLIHDATHNLIFNSVPANRMMLCIANIAHVVPSGMMFRYYHILHHIELNKIAKDPDVPAKWEARFVGNKPLRKAFWLFFFFLFQTVRLFGYSHRTPSYQEMKWIAVNWLVNLSFHLSSICLVGLSPLIFMLLSSIFAIGLHPLGARWIQEHYPTHPFQSTYSYYGIANRVAFNIGFHNEHHDFPSIPWNLLPKLRQLAPEYYDTLFAYRSYRKLLRDFIMEPRWSLSVRWEEELKRNNDLSEEKK